MDIIISSLDIVKKKAGPEDGPGERVLVRHARFQFLTAGHNSGGPMFLEEGLVPEPPAHRDTGQARILGSLDVYVGIANVHRAFRLASQLGQGPEYGVGGGLAGHPLGFPDGHLHPVSEIGLAQTLHCAVKLIGYHRRTDSRRPEPVQQLQHPGVGGGLVLHIHQVVGPEIGQHLMLQGLVRALRHRPVDQQPHAVAHEAADLLHRAGGQVVERQGVIGAVGQVLQGVQQGAVQIENGGMILHKRSPPVP